MTQDNKNGITFLILFAFVMGFLYWMANTGDRNAEPLPPPPRFFFLPNG